MTLGRCLSFTVFVALLAAPLRAETVSLSAAADNTLYEDFFGGYSNGVGDYFFAGRTNAGDIRRGLIRFNLSSIPTNATITGVSLKLNMSRTTAGAQPVALHRVLGSWGEGASNAEAQEGAGIDAAPGDATWVHRLFPSTNWTSPGGDYSAVASASRSVGGNGFYTWATAGMVSDVQNWLTGASPNSGWLLRGNEAATRTAKRFDTRENFDPAKRPVLTVDYTPVPEPTALLGLLMAGLMLRRR